MRKSLILTAALLATTPALAQVSPYDGEWGLGDVPECIDGDYSTCPVLHIANGEFRGEESLCMMTGVGPVPGMNATLYDLSCQGEGDTWAFRAALHLDVTNRLTVLSEYGPSIYLPTRGAPAAPATK